MSIHGFVSVVIPVLNEEKYIDRCIDSLFKQDFPQEKMEWLFIDGGSGDRTPEKLEKYAAEHPQLIRVLNNEHRTAPYAMNIGIRASRGEYIVRLDAHSEYASDYISSCIRVLNETGADNVGGFVETVSSQTRGAKSFETTVSIPLMPRAVLSAFFIATRFGTSSPNTRVMYESITVMIMTATELGRPGISF